jgi:hypothetical protein
MKIESIIRRKAGSSQTIDGITYRWNQANGHVCEVENPEHAKILLSHPEGWRPVAAQPNSEAGQKGGEAVGKPVDPAKATDDSKPATRTPRKSATQPKSEAEQGSE